jgi:hypothetical protein
MEQINTDFFFGTEAAMNDADEMATKSSYTPMIAKSGFSKQAGFLVPLGTK